MASSPDQGVPSLWPLPGWICLMGGGPGDPGLLTVRGRLLLGMAEAIVADPGLEACLGQYAPSTAQLWLVSQPAGRWPSQTTATEPGSVGPEDALAASRREPPSPRPTGGQQQAPDPEPVPGGAKGTHTAGNGPAGTRAISGLGMAEPVWAGAVASQEVVPCLTRWVRAGLRVVRLYRGDAASSPVAGAEMDQLTAAGVPWWVVPGVPGAGAAAEAVAATGGRPGSNRGQAQPAPQAGRSGRRLPLAGWRIVVTRPREQAESLAETLRQLGAEPVQAPLIAVHTAGGGELDACLSQWDAAWWVFTSANGVRAVAQRLEALNRDVRNWARCRVAVVGSATQSELWAQLRLRADLVPEVFTAARLWQRLAQVAQPGDRVIWPRGDRADLSPVEPLRRRGVRVLTPIAYETRLRPDVAAALAPALRSRLVDAITFSSPSAVEAFVQGLGPAVVGQVLNPKAEAGPGRQRPLVVCIGPRTGEKARQLGLPVDRMARESTVAGLVQALVEQDPDHHGLGVGS